MVRERGGCDVGRRMRGRRSVIWGGHGLGVKDVRREGAVSGVKIPRKVVTGVQTRCPIVGSAARLPW